MDVYAWPIEEAKSSIFSAAAADSLFFTISFGRKYRLRSGKRENWRIVFAISALVCGRFLIEKKNQLIRTVKGNSAGNSWIQAQSLNKHPIIPMNFMDPSLCKKRKYCIMPSCCVTFICVLGSLFIMIQFGIFRRILDWRRRLCNFASKNGMLCISPTSDQERTEVANLGM